MKFKKVRTSLGSKFKPNASFKDEFFVEMDGVDIKVAEYVKSRDLYCTIEKGGAPSNIRNKPGVTNTVRWDRAGLAKVFGNSHVDLSVFKGGGPNLTWGDKGPVLNLKGVKESILKVVYG